MPLYVLIADSPAPTPPAQAIEAAVTVFRLKHWKGTVSRVDTHLIAPRSTSPLSSHSLTLTVRPYARFLRPGRHQFEITVSKGPRTIRRFPVSVQIDAYTRVVLTQHTLESGRIIESHDTRLGE
jgi:hypothetical protein